MRKWMALGALILVGCNDPPPWHGDETFTPAERAEVERGAAFMSQHAGHASIVWDAPHVAENSCRPATIERSPDGWGGLTDLDGACIHLSTRPDQAAYIARLAAHELGHWAGLGHVTHGIMQPEADSQDLVWSSEDQAECERVGACD